MRIAADFMGRPRQLLEAHRELLYSEFPIPEGWHAAYAQGEVEINADQALERLKSLAIDYTDVRQRKFDSEKVGSQCNQSENGQQPIV